MSNQVGLGPW